MIGSALRASLCIALLTVGASLAVAADLEQGRTDMVAGPGIGPAVAAAESCDDLFVEGKWAEALIVKLLVTLSPNGDVVTIRPHEQQRVDGDPLYRTAYDRARRVIQCASPLKMPKETNGRWQEVVLTFDPSKFEGTRK